MLPQPEGQGPWPLCGAAVRDAGISISDIDYINLHGTGTRDNDLSEAKAIHALFPDENLCCLPSKARLDIPLRCQRHRSCGCSD
jgi:3-oxoacyl-(acyl-carrier-protein) synthase